MPTPPTPSAASLAASPDGRHIAFVAASLVDSAPVLYVRDLDNLEPRQLPGTEGATLPFWSPDSRQIGFAAQGELKRIDVAGGPPRLIARLPVFLPVGRGIRMEPSSSVRAPVPSIA